MCENNRGRAGLSAVVVALLFIAFFISAKASASAQNDVRSIADRVDKHYNSLTSLQADFAETYRGGGLTRNEQGTLTLKRPGRMRWDYRQPRDKVFIVAGKTAWFYLPSQRQVQKASVKSLDDLRTPLAYLLGRTKLDKVFEGLSIAPDVSPSTPGNIVLRGVPKNMKERVSQVLLEVTPDGVIYRISIEELDGTRTDFALTNQKANVPISDARFKFTPPPGVETIDTKADFSQ